MPTKQSTHRPATYSVPPEILEEFPNFYDLIPEFTTQDRVIAPGAQPIQVSVVVPATSFQSGPVFVIPPNYGYNFVSVAGSWTDDKNGNPAIQYGPQGDLSGAEAGSPYWCPSAPKCSLVMSGAMYGQNCAAPFYSWYLPQFDQSVGTSPIGFWSAPADYELSFQLGFNGQVTIEGDTAHNYFANHDGSLQAILQILPPTDQLIAWLRSSRAQT